MSNKLVLTNELQNKVLKVRIYPTNEQVSLLNQTFGCCRKLYNEHLQERNEFYIDNILPIKSKATNKKSMKSIKLSNLKQRKNGRLYIHTLQMYQVVHCNKQDVTVTQLS